METSYTVSTYLIKKLHECGVKHIFGVPGDYVLGLYDQLIRTKTLEVINTCDEQAGAFAGDAYARVRGLGVVCVTYCVGGLKVVNATAQAYAEKSPIVVISGAPGSKGRFRLTKVVRIDHKDDGNQIGGKIYDYSPRTIDKLIQDGYNNASIQMDIQSMKDEITELMIQNGKEDSDHHIETLQKRLHQIQASVKIQNGNLVTINLIEQFINEASHIKKIENVRLKEESAVLIDLAKQLQAEIKEKKV